MEERRSPLARLKPAVPRAVLYLLAGLVWTGVGGMLVALATGWIARSSLLVGVCASALGAGTAVFAWRALFSRIARRNIDRIRAKEGWACVFSFQAWRSYLLVAFMVALGVTLRHSAVPRAILAYVYLAIGGALILSSLAYYRLLAGPAS
jgi:hypothetical protein